MFQPDECYIAYDCGSSPPGSFVVLFDVVKKLLAASPLGAQEVLSLLLLTNFMSVRIRLIRRISDTLSRSTFPWAHEIFRCISFMVLPIGKFVKTKRNPGKKYQHILVVVETTLKLFPRMPRYFKLGGPNVTKICFDYVRHNLRHVATACFSYQHLPSRCIEKRPTFLNLRWWIRSRQRQHIGGLY